MPGAHSMAGEPPETYFTLDDKLGVEVIDDVPETVEVDKEYRILHYVRNHYDKAISGKLTAAFDFEHKNADGGSGGETPLIQKNIVLPPGAALVVTSIFRFDRDPDYALGVRHTFGVSYGSSTIYPQPPVEMSLAYTYTITLEVPEKRVYRLELPKREIQLQPFTAGPLFSSLIKLECDVVDLQYLLKGATRQIDSRKISLYSGEEKRFTIGKTNYRLAATARPNGTVLIELSYPSIVTQDHQMIWTQKGVVRFGVTALIHLGAQDFRITPHLPKSP